MTCRTNFNTKIIKMHDTNFYCCDEMKKHLSGFGRDYLKIFEGSLKYCFNCGKRMSLNSGF